jgi:hypothetical protein
MNALRAEMEALRNEMQQLRETPPKATKWVKKEQEEEGKEEIRKERSI